MCCIYFLYSKEMYVFYINIKYVDKSKINQNNCTAQVFLSNIYLSWLQWNLYRNEHTYNY